MPNLLTPSAASPARTPSSSSLCHIPRYGCYRAVACPFSSPIPTPPKAARSRQKSFARLFSPPAGRENKPTPWNENRRSPVPNLQRVLPTQMIDDLLAGSSVGRSLHKLEQRHPA